MGRCSFKAIIIFWAFGSLLVEAVELLGRWSLDELDNGQLKESLSQNASSTVLVAREGATNTRLGVLSVEDVNHLSVAVPNGDCLVDIDACGEGLGVSFWIRFKGLISDIIGDTYSQETTLKNWLDVVTGSDLRWINCYRATEHGWDASTFHSQCDYKGPTVTLVKVDKFVFGGFTDLDWGGSTGFKKSSISFLFTLANTDGTAGVKLDVQDTSKAIYNDVSYGPCFGDGDLVISDMAAINVNSSSRLGTSYSLPNSIADGSVDAVNFLAGSEYFMPDDLEVFHIECFHPLGMENGDILESQITQPTGDYKGPGDINNAPWQARLNNPSGNTWIPSDPSVATLIVDLLDAYHVIGIEAQGNNQFPSKPGYPTDFEIQYKSNSLSSSWNPALSGLSLDDAFSIKRFLFVPSFLAEQLKFILSQCVNNECGFAIEIYGCSAESCNQALRVESINASSSSSQYQPSEAQLDSSSCWKPLTDNDPNDYLQVDLGSVKLLQRVVTEALSSQTYVESYKIQYSTDGVKWEYYPNFDGTPKDEHVKVLIHPRVMFYQVTLFSSVHFSKVFTGGSGLFTVLLVPVVQVRFVRFYPVSGDKCVKLELRGCTSMKGGYAEILSSGSDPVDETGLLIFSESKIKAQYQTVGAQCYSKTSPLSSTEWTRFTFMLKENLDTRIFLDNVKVSSHEHPDETYLLNSEKMINLASRMSLSSFGWGSFENIQLSDLSVWRDIPGGGNSWENWASDTLPKSLDLCNFDDSPCSWKIGNWTIAKECVPSNSLGTGPCLDKYGGTGFYIHLESSYPRSKSESVRFESPYVISSYKCVTFWYHMWGEHVGRLNVFAVTKTGSEKLEWRLSGDQGNSWNEGSTEINKMFAYKIIFEAVVGDGFLGDIAIDEVMLSTTSCNTLPSSAKPGISASLSGHDLEKSAIIGHLEGFKTFLTQALNDAGVEDEIWIPCYRAFTDGRDVAEFYSRCAGKGMTVIIVRSDNYIFGGFTEKDWGRSLEKGAAVSYSAFLFSLSHKQGAEPVLFPLKTDKRYTAHPVRPGQGPIFGNGDLVLETMSNGYSELNNSFGTTADAGFLFAEANNFVISDVEVLYKGDTLCAELCNHAEGSCDEITGKCECDWSDRSIEWCLEGEPKKIINLYQDALSYWALDSLEELKDRARVGWDKLHGGVNLDSKGLSGQALQLDGVSGWIDLGDLSTACPEAGCSEDFSISMWFKYNPKESNEDQSFLTLDSGVLDFELFYDAALKEVGVALNTATLSASYMFSVFEGFWTYLGVSWNSVEQYIGIQLNGETLPTTITWYVCHACERSTNSNTSVTIGNGSFPNASFDEIGIWFQALENQNFVDIYNTYKGPERLHVELSLQFTDIPWKEDFLNPESANYTALLQNLRDEITTFYSSMPDVVTSSDNITMSKCWDDDGVVSCDLQVNYYSAGYKQLKLLLDDWLPSANVLGASEIVLLRSRNDNVPSTAVSGLTANAAGPSSVSVSWDPPPEEDNPGILINYEINYKAVGSENWLTEQVWNTDEPFVITELEIFTNYTVSVTMVNLEGKGIAASVNVSTEEGAPPRPPANVTASNTTSTSIALEWDPPEGPIPGILRGYRVFYARAPDIINTTVYTTVDNEDITYHIARDMTLRNVTIYDVDLTEYTVTELEPYTRYFLWVTAFTVSDSQNSHAVSWATEEDVPDAAPLIYEVTTTNPKECLLSWSPIPAEHHRGVLLGYRIVYTPESDALNSSNITVSVSEYRGIPVNGLRDYTKYLLKVAGFTSKGDGNYSTVEDCQTLESVPSLPPVGREVYNVTSTSCEIRWGPIPDEHQNGVIIGYELQYAPHSRDALQIRLYELQRLSLGANTSSYRLTGLNSYTQYSISIVGETSAGKGAHGGVESWLSFTTEGDYPSASPTGLSVIDSTASSCWVNWIAIPEEDTNGEMVSYEVHVEKNESAGQGLEGEASTTVLVCGNATEANATMLDVFTTYSIKVAFHNNIGIGNYSDTVECITGEGAPSLPPQNIRGHNTSSSSIKIYWEPVPEANRHGIVREYHFYIYPIQSTVSSFDDVDTTGDLYKTFTGLEPYSNYSIQMAAKTVELGNFSEPIFVMTDEAAPTTAPEIVQAYNTSDRSIFVRWTPPLGPVPGIIRGYRIFYQNLNSSLSPVEKTSVDANTLSYDITSLEPYSEYIINILAFTVADGPKSASKSVYTDKKVLPPPDGIPENVMLGDKTSTSCFILWDAAGNSIEDTDGAILGYYIYFREDGSNNTFDRLDVQEENRTGSDVKELQEYTRYEFHIAAYSYYGEGNASDVFHCVTEEDAPSASPINVTSVQVTARGIQIEWYLPKEEDWNGIIRGFTIIYYRKDEGNSSAKFVDVPVSSLNVQLPGQSGNGGLRRRRRATELSWFLTGLEEYTIYIIYVLFYTVGISPYSLPLEIQTAEDAPSSSPTGVFATNNGSSTSLWITWSDVPDIDQNGVITSFVIGYWLKDDIETRVDFNVSKSSVSSPAKRRKRASGASYNYVLEGLGIWTEYYVVIAAVTVSQGPFSEPYLVQTDEGVPCLPPQYVTYDVPGLSMLLAKWQPVPAHCRNGVILGYRVKYRRLDGGYPARIESTTAEVLHAFLYDMDIYANYSIEISAFTRKGEGAATLDLALPDTLGPKKTPVNVTSYNYTSTTSVNVTWLPFNDLFILERMLGYRVSYRAVKVGDEDVESGEAPTHNFTVRKTTLTALIEGLESYTRYQINVSGFSRRGDGPSAITEGDTCRCQKRLASNYRTFPPYVDQLEVSGDGRITVENMTGMLPKILDDLVITCCQTCGAHGRSYVDFEYNGTNGTAKQNSEKEMKFLIQDRNDLSFPVYGWRWQEYYSADYRYIPLVESPGVAFIIIEKKGLSPSQRLVNEVFATWPYMVITTLLAALAGIVIWFLDTKSNPDHFPQTFLRGSGNGFWWAFISMTTLGYGDKAPKANVSKAFAIVWILTGLVMTGILSGALTSAITIFVFDADIILYGTKVAVIQDTPEYRLAVARNARVNEAKHYTTFTEVYNALINEDVQGMLIDTYEAGYKKDQFKDPRIRIHSIYDYKSTYGVVLAGNSTKLLQCSKSYMQSHRAEMYEHIAKFIHFIEEERVPETLEVSSGLFDAQNDIFRHFSYVISACLAVAIILGVMWEYRRKVRVGAAQQHEGRLDGEKSRELLEEMRTFVAEFYCNFKANYAHLLKRHQSQIKSFKAQHPNSKLLSNNWTDLKQGFFNESYGRGMKFSSIVDYRGVKPDRVTALLH